MDEQTTFFIGHHDSKRAHSFTLDTVQQAHSSNYDMITCPITNSHFHSRVLTLLSSSSAWIDEEITRSRNASPLLVTPLTPEDTPLTPDISISHIVAITSKWVDLSSSDPVIADISRQVLHLELTYAAFCGVSHVVIHGPHLQNGCDVNQFARAILEGMNHSPYTNLYLWFPMTHDRESTRNEMGDLTSFARNGVMDNGNEAEEDKDLFGTWEAWNTVRALCKYSSRLCVALSLSKSIPPEIIQSRWYSEPVRIISLNPDTFVKNAKGYPTLTTAYQTFILRMARLKPGPWLLLCDLDSLPQTNMYESFPTPAESIGTTKSDDQVPHLTYMRYLQNKTAAQTAQDRFSSGYQDYLQAPLQPLTVNLESITYEVFEKDPVKYDWYERAVARALHDWIEQGKPTSNPDGRIVVAVVGAGRGPLVTRALRASEDVGVDIDMWALEKNPNAFVLLQRHNQDTWHNAVSLVKSDMRAWNGPVSSYNPSTVRKRFNMDNEDSENVNDSVSDKTTQAGTRTNNSNPGEPPNAALSHPYKIDILISELLGSFADNELSPECLDGVQHLLNPVHGISIPSSYTAQLTPIAAPKLHADISLNMTSTTPEAAEIPYVVLLNAIDYLSVEQRSSTHMGNYSASANQTIPKPIVNTAWSFHHPNSTFPASERVIAGASNMHNARHARLSFPINNQGVCHGLGGYFEAVLYPGVELSTNPNTKNEKSEAMISWFPIYFPLKTPVYIPSNSQLDVSIWRRTVDRKVWYEWIVEVFAWQSSSKGRIHKVKVGGSDLHSSEKEACLM